METNKEKVAIFGDSIFKGVIYNLENKKYQMINKPCVNSIIEKLDMIPDNYSKFGLTSDKALEIIKRNLNNENNYKYAVVEIGGNDCDFKWTEISSNPESIHYPNVRLEDYEKNITTIINEIRKNNIIPIIVTLPPISSKKYFNWFSQTLNKDNILKWLKEENNIYKHQELYSNCLSNVARKLNVALIDVRLYLLSIKDFEDYICIDGIHLNESGHKIIEESFNNINIIPSI